MSKKSSPPGTGEKEITLHEYKDLSSYEHPDKKLGSHSPVRPKLWGREWLDDLGAGWLQV